MPKFYFHLYDDCITPDDEGQEFPDFETAVMAAHSAARGLLSDELAHQGRIALCNRIEIEGEDRQLLDTVHFADAVEVIEEEGDRRRGRSRAWLLEQARKCRQRAQGYKGRLADTFNAMASSYEKEAASN